MAGFGGSIKLSGESEYKKALKNIQQGLKEVSSEMKLMSAEAASNDKNTEKLTKQSAELSKKLDEQKKAISTLKTAFSDMSKQYDEQRKKTESLQKSYDDEKKKLADIKSALGENSDEYKTQAALVDKLEKELKESTSAEEGMAKSLSNMKIQINNAEASVVKTQNALDGMNKELDQTDDEAKEAGKGLQDVGKTAEDAKAQFSGLGKVVGASAKALGAAMAAVGATAVAAGKAIWDMANDTAAAGDEIDKQSQKLQINAELYQQLDYACERSGTSIGSLKQGIKGITKELGKAQSGTEGAGAKFEKLGISLKNADGSLKSTEEVMMETLDTLAGMEDETARNAAANELFGKSASELLPLLNSGSDGIKELMQEAKDYGMVMSEDAVSASAAFEDSLTRLQGSFEGLKNGLVGELLPGLTSVTDGFSLLVVGNDKGAESIKNGVESMLKAVRSALPIVEKVLGAMAEAAISVLPDALKDLLKSIQPLLRKIPQLIGDLLPSLLAMTTDMIKDLGSLIPELLNSDIIDNTIDTIVNALPDMINGAMAFLMGIIDAIPLLIEKLVPVIPSIVTTIVTTLTDHIDTLIDGALALLMGIIDAIPLLIEALVPEIPTIVIAISKALIKEIPRLLKSSLEMFGALLTGLQDTGKAIVKSLPGMVKEIVTGLVKPLKTAFKELWDYIKELFGKLPAFFGDLWTKVKDKFTAIGTKIGDAISGAVKSGINGIIGQIEKIINSGIKLINGAMDFINEIPGVDIGNLSLLNLPRLARGGIIDRPTIAQIGENGKEAVMPLEHNTEWIRELAANLKDVMVAPISDIVKEAPQNNMYLEMVGAFKDALGQMKVELDDEEVGSFVEQTVANAIYA